MDRGIRDRVTTFPSIDGGPVFLPDGEELEKRGVTPDKVCIPTEEDLREEHDPCKDMALVLARKALGTTEQEQKED